MYLCLEFFLYTVTLPSSLHRCFPCATLSLNQQLHWQKLITAQWCWQIQMKVAQHTSNSRFAASNICRSSESPEPSLPGRTVLGEWGKGNILLPNRHREKRKKKVSSGFSKQNSKTGTEIRGPETKTLSYHLKMPFDPTLHQRVPCLSKCFCLSLGM